MNIDDREHELFDCIIIGGGPAGLVAATYLSRFRRRVLVVDAGSSRASKIPCINNCPGFPDGIPGRDLLKRLREQAERYRASFVDGAAEGIEQAAPGFVVHCGTFAPSAPRLLLATGLVDRVPDLAETKRNIERGALRLCPVCDGYEAIDKRIAVLGGDGHALQEAIFLKTYSTAVTLLSLAPLLPQIHADAARAGISVYDDVAEIVSDEGGYTALLRGGATQAFDILYPALGCRIRSDLAGEIGVVLDEHGHIPVGRHQETNIEGVYAAGDVVHSLNQIAVAFGQAATAATAIHNSLKHRGSPTT